MNCPNLLARLSYSVHGALVISVFAIAVSISSVQAKCVSHAVLDTGSDLSLEPSGLVYSKELDAFIGVTDDGNYRDPDIESNNDSEAKWLFFSVNPSRKTDGCIDLGPLYREDDKKNKKSAKQISVENLLPNSEIEQLGRENEKTKKKGKPFPYDLEGITTDGKNYYAIGSLSRHADDPSRDYANRYQLLKFALEDNTAQPDKDKKKITNLSLYRGLSPVLPNNTSGAVTSSNGSYNFRTWVLNKSIDWPLSAIMGKSENEGGLNIEGLTYRKASYGAKPGTKQPMIAEQLVLGVRGPIIKRYLPQDLEFAAQFHRDDTRKPEKGYPFLLVFDIVGTDETPRFSHVEILNKFKLDERDGASMTYGVRAIDFVDFNDFENNKIKLKGYAVVLGAANSAYDPLVAGFIPLSQVKDVQGKLASTFDSGKLLCETNLHKKRKNFVGEGIAAIEAVKGKSGEIDVLIVDDLNNEAMSFRWKLDISDPSNPKCKH